MDSRETFGVWDWLHWTPQRNKWFKEGQNEEQSKAYLGYEVGPTADEDGPTVDEDGPTADEAGSPAAFREPGIHFCFLPKVDHMFRDDRKFCDHLSECMNIPPMFWEETGWNSNGFFWALPRTGEEEAVATVARFLLKEVKPEHDGSLHYAWRFFGFASKWSMIDGRSGECSTVFLIFDCGVEEDGMTHEMMAELAHRLERRNDASELHRKVLGAYVLLLEPLLSFFDKSLWGFRKPVRNFEKNRLAIETATRDVYHAMHELSRHVIHATETLEAAEEVLSRMLGTHDLYDLNSTPSNQTIGSSNDNMDAAAQGHSSHQSKADDQSLEQRRAPSQIMQSTKYAPPRRQTDEHTPDRASGQIRESLAFYGMYFKALQLRASAFDKRLNNEIMLAHHTVTARETITQEGIIQRIKSLQEEMKDDGRHLARLVSYLTVSFLPGSFFTGFFGMNVLSFTPSGDSTDSSYWEASGWQISKWIFLPIGIIILATILCWIMVLYAGLLSFLSPEASESSRRWPFRLFRRPQISKEPVPSTDSDDAVTPQQVSNKPAPSTSSDDAVTPQQKPLGP